MYIDVNTSVNVATNVCVNVDVNVYACSCQSRYDYKCVCVQTHVRICEMCVCVYVGMYVRMYVCECLVSMCVYTFACKDVCVYESL